MVDLATLATLEVADVERLFADIPAEELVDAVRALDDDSLWALVNRDEIRPVAVAGILARLHEYAVPAMLERVEGRVRLELDRRGKVLETHVLSCAGGALVLAEEPVRSGPVDVTLRTSIVRFIRLVSGEHNAGLEYLSGHLDIDGDADLALAVGGMFRVPGSDEVAVDPTALDPVAVATALSEVDSRHLKKVMASGFRPVVLEEIFRRLPEFVNQRKAGTSRLDIGFRLLGNPTGEVERYHVSIDAGAATVSPGEEGQRRDATISCEGHDFLRLATGHLNPVAGVLKGTLKVKGDKAKALHLSSLIDFPKAG
jgi:putative sterol carrier protein